MESNFGNHTYHSDRNREIRESWRAYQAAKQRGAKSSERRRLLEDWRARVRVRCQETDD